MRHHLAKSGHVTGTHGHGSLELRLYRREASLPIKPTGNFADNYGGHFASTTNNEVRHPDIRIRPTTYQARVL
ncbi:hypothetical protein H1S01_19410 [Heliobacterium chlorum]|uniref:Uncharacterized protein n=1 Tax=Heliobacterium chlorum TaxID=2698 RepID=A0ABR7T7K9_HELCL|nr:hypothetical protein [Heliobacterium chlorum]MBC9786616.1 hypothetical protein [Heliobacterium chlorum]